MNIHSLIRPHLINIKPYSSARDEFSGEAHTFLDANENSLGSVGAGQFNRYPDPHQQELKSKLSQLNGIAPENIFIGNGSDEPIDLLIRLFCEPAQDNIIICPPTYGMYAVSATINNVAVREVLLTENFQLNTEAILSAYDTNSKIVFVCSPNNPTGNLIHENDIEPLLKNFNGIVVIDEAYIDFAEVDSWSKRISEYNNLVVLQTFSKAWGLANLRVGLCFASLEIIRFLNLIKPPYNVNGYSQQQAMVALNNFRQKEDYVKILILQRKRLEQALPEFGFIHQVFPSDANFILIKVTDANLLYNYLLNEGIIVRNRSSLPLCENTLRITVGTPEENDFLLERLNAFV